MVPEVGTLDLDIIIVAFGAPALLERCLSTLGEARTVSVVDNSSDRAVRAVAERHQAAYLDPGRNLGFSAGVNLGIEERHRPGRDVLLLNPDATIDRDGLSALYRCLHARSDLACVAPVQVDPVTDRAVRVQWPFPSPTGAWIEAMGLGRLRRPGFVIGSVLLLRAEAVSEVGPFDERFFLYSEETDWQRRAVDRGWTVACCSEARATHVGAGTGGDAIEREVHFHASNERYLRKHFGPRGWWAYRTGFLFGTCLRAIVLPGERGRQANLRLGLYRRGPCRAESELPR